MEPCTSLWWYTWIVVYKPLVATSGVYKSLVADGVFYKPLVACVDRCSQVLGGRWRHLHAFGGIRGSSCARLLVAYMDPCVKAFGGIRGLSIASLCWLTWIAVHKPLEGYVDYHVKAFGGIRESSFTSIWWQMEPFTSLWWYTWIVVYKPLVATSVVYKPLVADGVFNKPLVACVDRRSQALGGRWSRLQAFGGIRGSIVVCKAPGGVHGSSCRNLWWHTWIVDCKPLVAYVDRHSQAFGGRWSHLQAFGARESRIMPL